MHETSKGRNREDVHENLTLNKEEIFDALFRSHYKRVVAYIQRRTINDGAEDIAEEVFLRIWTNIHKVPMTNYPEGALPWILGVAMNVTYEQQRKNQRHLRVVSKIESLRINNAFHIGGPEELIRVGAAMRMLQEADREILRLRAWEELEIEQIASVLECRVSTARVRLHRARRRLLKALEYGK